MDLYIAVKTFPYYSRPKWLAAGDMRVETPAFEAGTPEEAHERALQAVQAVNPFLGCLPGEIQLYRLDPLGDPLRVGVEMENGHA